MLINFFRLTFRNIAKYKAYSLISILGLTIGFCAYMLISLYINYEYSWDKHNENYERIYRVQRTFTKALQSTNKNNISPHTRGITARLLEGKYPGIEKIAMLREDRGSYLSSTHDKIFWEEKGFSSDQVVFDVFSFEFLEGSKERSLHDPFTIILSKTIADKLYPNESAVGKTVIIEKKYNLKITGVYKDFPFNSEFRPDYLISLSSYDKFEDSRNSTKSDYFTYVLLNKGQDYHAVSKKITGLYRGFKDFEEEELSLCPLSMIYLSFNGNRDYMMVLFIYRMIGIFILLLSAFNYVNITTAHASVRNKEVAVKKIFGSHRRTMILQFQAETLVTSMIGVCLAMVLTEFMLPLFNRVIAKELELTLATEWAFILRMVIIGLFVGFLSGLYPAFFMSGRKPLELFKGHLFKSSDKSVTRKILIVLQFSIAILFIILTLNFNMQLKYLLSKDIGFTRENLLYALISVTREDANWEYLRGKILSHQEIRNASMSKHIPMVTFGGHLITWEGAPSEEILLARDNYVSYDYVETMDMHIVKGRNFSRDFPADKNMSCIINETAARTFEWDNPIGKKIDNRFQVVGVVKDFHNIDIYNKIEPFFMVLTADSVLQGGMSLAFRVDPEKVKKAREIIQSELEAYFPLDPFEIKDFDETFVNQKVMNIYKTIQNLVLFFTCLNIIIAIVGLLGLVSFTTQRRTKEIGIRKINGSTGLSVFLKLSLEYLALVGLASAIAWPVAYLLNTKSPGTYRYAFQIWPYFFATAAVIFIIFVTSLYHTLKAANSNPVDALRYE